MSTRMSTAEKRKQSNGNSSFMEIGEAMALLNVSRATLYRLLKRKEIPGAIKVGNSWRILASKFWEGMEKKAR
jgi:excisionase family DNA binding protein